MWDERIRGEASGKRRVWKAATAAQFAKVLAAFANREVRRAAKEFAHRTGRHTAAALALRNAFDRCARLEHMDLKSRPPLLVWSAIDAPPESPLHPTEVRALTPEEKQHAASIHYIMTADAKHGHLIRGLWSSSYADHAIGRLCQRWPRADVSEIIRQGHRKLMSIPSRNITDLLAQPGFIVPTDEGAWWASAAMSKATQTGAFILHVRCRSWLHDGMITRSQRALADELLTPREGDTPLGSTLLHPMTLRRPAETTAA
jgi:hypothetical protein